MLLVRSFPFAKNEWSCGADRCCIAKKPYNEETVISTYKRLIQRLPRANQYLLLYVLDLLSVFARKSDINLMTATSGFACVFCVYAARTGRRAWTGATIADVLATLQISQLSSGQG